MIVYEPANGGFSSMSRRYSGFSKADVTRRQLRPRRPVHLRLESSDTVSITNIESGSSVWLVPFDVSGLPLMVETR